MQLPVIVKDASWCSIEDSDLLRLIRKGKIIAFFCPCSIEWVYGRGFCENCKIKHLASTGNFHTCFFHRKQTPEN
jgi:hypothetical protein